MQGDGMKFEDLNGDGSADLQLSLQAMQSQAHAGISLDLMQQQRLAGLSVLQQQILIQQQHQLLHAQALLQAVPQSVPESHPLSMAPSLSMGLGLGMGLGAAAVPTSVGATVPEAVVLSPATPAVGPAALAKQQQRASAADIWREKKRRLAAGQDGCAAKQTSADPDAAAQQDVETAARGGSSGAGAPGSAGGTVPGAIPAAAASKGPGEPSGRAKVPADKRKEESRRKRLLRNRVSAQQARERKRSYIQELENQCAELEAKNLNIENQISSLSQENDGLRQMMKRKVRATRVDMEEPAVEEEEGAVDQ